MADVLTPHQRPSPPRHRRWRVALALALLIFAAASTPALATRRPPAAGAATGVHRAAGQGSPGSLRCSLRPARPASPATPGRSAARV